MGDLLWIPQGTSPGAQRMPMCGDSICCFSFGFWVPVGKSEAHVFMPHPCSTNALPLLAGGLHFLTLWRVSLAMQLALANGMRIEPLWVPSIVWSLSEYSIQPAHNRCGNRKPLGLFFPPAFFSQSCPIGVIYLSDDLGRRNWTGLGSAPCWPLLLLSWRQEWKK